ncbi:MAG: efflux RND transporter periplasmic adaptor subunit [Clostridiales bacterium]|nr:efflux RND transporter periplasmic adaptor subunit [Clostridiales bacterium]
MASEKKNAPTVELVAAKKAPIVEKTEASGTVDFGKTVPVYPNAQTIVKKVLVSSGDFVRPGDILVEYDTEALADLELALSAAMLDEAVAKMNLDDYLLPAGSAETLGATSAVNQAQSAVRSLEGQIEELNDGMYDLEIKIEEASTAYEEAKDRYVKGLARKEEVDAANWKTKELAASFSAFELNRNALLSSLPAAKENYARASQLLDSIVNKQSDPRVKSKIETLRMAHEQAELRRKDIERRIAEYETSEICEMSGAVVKVHVRDGEAASPGMPVLELADTTDLLIRADIPEAQASGIKIGQIADVSGYASESGGLKASVRHVAVSGVTRMSETVLPIELKPESGSKLKAGFTVDISIVTKTDQNAIVVPMTSVVEKDGAYHVFVLGTNYAANKRAVELGGFNGTNVQAKGVSEGELVIVNPEGIKDGDLVNPIITG